MKRRTVATNPVARAVAVQQWTQQGIDAQLQAFMGADARKVCNAVGRMLFVALGAAITEGLSADEPDLRVIRGAVNSLYDMADLEDVPEGMRQSVISGLEAVKRIAARVKVKSLADAHFDLIRKLSARDVRMSDFSELLAQPEPTK